MSEFSDEEYADNLLARNAMTEEEARRLLRQVVIAALRFDRTGELRTNTKEGWQDFAEALRITMVLHADPGYRGAIVAAEAEVAEAVANGAPLVGQDVREAIRKMRDRAREGREDDG